MKAYMLKQAAICSIINMIVNPLVSWLGNQAMSFTNLADILVDMAITSLVMSTLIAFFTVSGFSRDIKTGRIHADAEAAAAPKWLSFMHGSWWFMGILFGVGFAVVLVPVTYWLAASLGFQGLNFRQLVLFKIVYTGTEAFLVTRWVIQRQLQKARPLPDTSN